MSSLEGPTLKKNKKNKKVANIFRLRIMCLCESHLDVVRMTWNGGTKKVLWPFQASWGSLSRWLVLPKGRLQPFFPCLCYPKCADNPFIIKVNIHVMGSLMKLYLLKMCQIYTVIQSVKISLELQTLNCVVDSNI